MAVRGIRSEDRIIHSFGNCLVPTFLGAFTFVGAIFSLTSRVPLSFLKQKVSLNQFATVWISSLALAILAVEFGVGASQQQKRRKTNIYLLSLIVFTSIGIIAYRTGIFSKKPS